MTKKDPLSSFLFQQLLSSHTNAKIPGSPEAKMLRRCPLWREAEFHPLQSRGASLLWRWQNQKQTCSLIWLGFLFKPILDAAGRGDWGLFSPVTFSV